MAAAACRAAQTGWTAKQRNHLRRLMRQGARIAYWCSDAQGRPANHRMEPAEAPAWAARPGLVQEVAGPLRACSEHALHATLEPHRWAGCRVWVVGLVGEVVEGADRLACLRREIVGEVLPECALDPSVGVRVGRRDLAGANLSGANLSWANLSGADLSGAYLSESRLAGANLSGCYYPTGDVPVGWSRTENCRLKRAP